VEKSSIEYVKVLTRIDGLSFECLDCNRIKQQKYKYKDHEGYKKRTRENYQKNKEHINERNRENSKKPEAKEKKKIRMREYMKRRRKADPVFRMITNFRRRHREALKGELKVAPTLEMLGCSSKIAFWFLEQQYYPHPETGEEMTQENYGLTTWNYDHIMPLITFDYSDPDQQRKAFHITNCRPMWADENKSRPDTRPEGVTFEDLRKPLFPGEELKND
jgi:choline dehydrogenase-like flavoprotein